MHPTDPEPDAEPVLVVPERVSLADVPRLCARLEALYATGSAQVVCDLGALLRADLTAVETVARLALTARRSGGSITLRNTGPGLRALLHLTGLAELAETTPPAER
ncbi:STAS domain-containing protein [Streptomyces sp. NPDC020719]|uniref:STAS domain-containing protein n=1 Tax=Streptomyces sp. NPDC020719 TaxID=3154896 RepID=UPI00341009FF